MEFMDALKFGAQTRGNDHLGWNALMALGSLLGWKTSEDKQNAMKAKQMRTGTGAVPVDDKEVLTALSNANAEGNVLNNAGNGVLSNAVNTVATNALNNAVTSAVGEGLLGSLTKKVPSDLASSSLGGSSLGGLTDKLGSVGSDSLSHVNDRINQSAGISDKATGGLGDKIGDALGVAGIVNDLQNGNVLGLAGTAAMGMGFAPIGIAFKALGSVFGGNNKQAEQANEKALKEAEQANESFGEDDSSNSNFHLPNTNINGGMSNYFGNNLGGSNYLGNTVFSNYVGGNNYLGNNISTDERFLRLLQRNKKQK